MAEKINNILIYYREDKVMYRVTKIQHGTVIEVDELVEDRELAEDLVHNLALNTEKTYGFKAQYSESPKNRILGDKALILVKFGNLGVEIGLSVRPIVNKFDNMNQLYIATDKDHIYLSSSVEGNDEVTSQEEDNKPKGLLEKLKSWIK